ncbi:MAG: ISL3 family transposase [Solirubrobacteraceae bacterium]
MRSKRVWARLLGLGKAVVEAVEIAADGAVVVAVRPRFSQRDRCPHCRRRCPGYDLGEGRRCWRALDLGTTFCFLEADAPRVSCKQHGVVVAMVPWARHDSWFTGAFEDQCAWLAVNTSKSAICELMRISWRTVGRICERVTAEQKQGRDLLSGLSRLGFDEISVRKGQRYLTVVVDHHSGRLVWAHAGRDRKTVEKFLDLLGNERCKQVKLVSCDDAEWITRPVSERCPNAVIALDPFHVVKAATDALDEIRREVWNEARRAGNKQLAAELKGARFALWKNAGNLTDRQQLKLATIQQTNQRLYRAYLLAQQLRQIYRVPVKDALVLLEAWLKWARRSRLEPFRKLARRITEQRERVEAAFKNGLSNARVEQINTQIRLIMRRGFGYHSEDAVIALAMLSLGGLCPPLPGR